MALYLAQMAYTSDSWAAQIKNPQNRVETVARAAAETLGGKLVGGWLCMGEYDAVFIFICPMSKAARQWPWPYRREARSSPGKPLRS